MVLGIHSIAIMPKQQKTKPSSNVPKKPQKPRQRSRTVTNAEAQQYKRLLEDPCAAPYCRPYPGEVGIVQRFVTDLTVNTTALYTAGVLMIIPGGNNFATAGAAASNTALTANSGALSGQSFLVGASKKARAMAACATVIPSAVSMTNITGELACGIVSSDMAITGQTVDGIFQLLTGRSVIAKRPYDVKFMPGVSDQDYNIINGANGFTFTDGSNAIVIAWRGYPAAVGLSVRVTNVLEWTPIPNNGIATSNLDNTVEYGLAQRVAGTMSNANPHWWHNLAEQFSSAGSLIAGYAAPMVGRAALAGLKASARAAPLLLA